MLKGKGGLLLFCSIPPAAPSVQLRSITSITQHFRERKMFFNTGLETMFPFHNNLLVFWGNISSLGQYKKPKNLTLKDWWPSPELEAPQDCSRTSSCPSTSRDLGCLKKQVEQLLHVQLPCGPQGWRIWSLSGKGGRRWVGSMARMGWPSILVIKTAEGVPGVPLAMLETWSFSERFVGTNPFLHHFFCSHHVGVSWQAKPLL